MDKATADFYRHYAENGAIQAEAPHSAISKYFDRAFEPGGKILDVGAGSGRDLAVLCELGFDAYGIEPNESMRRFALQSHPELAPRLRPGSLPLTGSPFGADFDGVLCSAVMMHIPEGLLRSALESIRGVLKPGGRVLFSLPSMLPNLLDDDRDPDGRFFQNHPLATVSSVLQSLGFSPIDLGEQATTKLSDISWTILLFELSRTAA